MKYHIGSLLTIAVVVFMTGCRSYDSYTIDDSGNECEVHFIKEAGVGEGPMKKITPMNFPSAEAEKVIARLKTLTKFHSDEQIYDICVFQNYIRIETLIETEKEKRKRIREQGTEPIGVKGRVIRMRKRNNKWIVSEISEKAGF